jgi:hypothetical protein
MSKPLGLLDGITDPVLMAKLAERRRIEERVAEQMGLSVREAQRALYEFEVCLCSDGHTIH